MPDQPFFVPTGCAILIEIVRVPNGEAPEWVRQAWLGLQMPLEYVSLAHKLPQIFSGEPVSLPGLAVHVDQEAALFLLEDPWPGAAAWWRKRGFPKSGEYFVFHADDVKVLVVPNPWSGSQPSDPNFD